MAVQLPLNHLVTDLHSPDQSCVQVLEGNIAGLKLKAFALSTLEKVCYVALIALAATVFAISYNFVVLTGTASLAMTGLVLVSPILVIAPARLSQLANQYSLLAQNEDLVCLKLREIENWNREQIEQFMEDNELDIERLPLPALRQINPNDSHKALLPLIARFNAMKEQIDSTWKDCREAPEKLEQKWKEKEERDGTEIESAIKQKIRFENQCTCWKILELNVIPNALNAATLLQMIENPSMTDLDVVPFSLEIPGVGHCATRSYAERMFGKRSGHDEYFIFHPDLHRPALTHAKIEEENMNLSRLRQLLYPRA